MGLWYRCGTKGPLTYGIGGWDRIDTAYEDHQILSLPCSGTALATEGHEGIIPRSYSALDTLEGIGRDREGYPVALRLRSESGSKRGTFLQ